MFEDLSDSQLHQFILEFIQLNKKGLKTIVHKTGGDLTIDEITAEIWLLIKCQPHKFERFDETQIQDAHQLLLAILHNDWVKEYRSKSIGRHQKCSLDAPLRADDNEESDPKPLGDIIRASSNVEPLKIILAQEKYRINEKAIKDSYSEACAYVLLFRRFLSEEKIISILKISLNVFRQRMNRAFFLLEQQLCYLTAYAISTKNFHLL